MTDRRLEDGEGALNVRETADVLIFHNRPTDPVHGGDPVKTGLTGSDLFVFVPTALSNLRRLL